MGAHSWICAAREPLPLAFPEPTRLLSRNVSQRPATGGERTVSGLLFILLISPGYCNILSQF